MVLCVSDMMLLQYVGTLPEADWANLFGSSPLVYPHSGWQLAHPADPAATLHNHAGEHTHRTGGMYIRSFKHCQIKFAAAHNKNYISFVHSF